jgi:hypothetical protein
MWFFQFSILTASLKILPTCYTRYTKTKMQVEGDVIILGPEEVIHLNHGVMMICFHYQIKRNSKPFPLSTPDDNEIQFPKQSVWKNVG